MKGLLIKDYYCLREELRSFLATALGVIVLAVLFALSARFGNLHRTLLEEIAEHGEEEGDLFVEVCRFALLCAFFLPMAFTGNVSGLFTGDLQAGFAKVESAVPVPLYVRVFSRYLSGGFFIAAGFVMSLAGTSLVSALTDLVSFGEFFGALVTFAAVMTLYLGMFLFLEYALGAERTNWNMVFPVLAAIVWWMCWMMLRCDLSELDGSTADGLSRLIRRAEDAIKHRYGMVFGVSLLVLVLSYLGSVCAEHLRYVRGSDRRRRASAPKRRKAK